MHILREKMYIPPLDMNIFAKEISISRGKMLISGEKMLIFPPNMLIS